MTPPKLIFHKNITQELMKATKCYLKIILNFIICLDLPFSDMQAKETNR